MTHPAIQYLQNMVNRAQATGNQALIDELNKQLNNLKEYHKV